MKLNRITKPLLLAVAVLFSFGLILSSCQVQEPVEAATEAPEVAAKGSGFGACTSCPFTQPFVGGLYNHLYPNSPWMLALQDCLVEDLDDFGYNCQPFFNSVNVSTSFQVFLAGANSGGQSIQDFCNHLQSTWSQILANRPYGKYYLVSVDDMDANGKNTFDVDVTWRKYICEKEPTRN